MLFELLTGEPPFTAEKSLDRAYQRLKEDVPAPSSLIDGVPPLMDALVAEATARAPEERFADAGEFLSALNDVSKELNLSPFTVPVPEDSAANRVAAIPPDVRDLDSPLAATGFIDPADATRMEAQAGSDASPAANETAVVPGAAPAYATAVVPGKQTASPRPPTQRPAQQASKPAVSNRSGGGLAVWTIVVLLILGAVAVGAWWLGSGRYGEVPQVIGMDQDQAAVAIQEAGFSASVQEVYSDSPSNTIVGSEPSEGDRLLRGKSVALMVSVGKPSVPDIPDGADLDTYRKLLEERSLGFEQGSSVYSDTVDEGKVAEVSPAAGTQVSLGTTVKVSLSKGTAPVEVPDVRGMTEDEARSTLEDAGLKVGTVTEDFDSGIENGKAIRTWPISGTEVHRGDAVELRLSRAVTIPDLEGYSEDEARQILSDLGVTVGSITTDSSYGGTNGDEIAKTSPEAGTLIDPESEKVDLVQVGNAKVPSLIGKKVSEARELVEERGFKLDAGSASDDDRVVTQSPAADKFLKPGETVKVRAI